MSYVARLMLFFAALMAVAILSAGLAFWSARSSEQHLRQAALAHRVHESYLSLSNQTYQLFKQYGDALLIGDRDRGTGEAALLQGIRREIREIRDLIGREVALVGTSEIAELELLARIEALIGELLAELEVLKAPDGKIAPKQFGDMLVRILDTGIDSEFRMLIEEAVAGEAAIAVLAATLGFVVLRRPLTRPIEALVAGSEALASGDFEHRIPEEGPSELARVAAAFNAMIGQLGNRNDRLTASRTILERTVARRTRETELALEQLREAEANRRRLLADVSHELRTPLTVIRGEAEIALRGGAEDPGPYRETIARIRDAAIHTARIVDDLLLIARHEGGEMRLRPEEIDLSETAAAVVASYSGRGTTTVFALETDAADSILLADPVRIRQVLTILLENALLYGGDRVDIRIAQAPDGLAVTVADNGPGLTEKERANAFDRYFRGAGAAERYDAGSGLGLPVAKAIVEAHGGRIALAAAPAGGLEVRIALPRDAGMAAA